MNASIAPGLIPSGPGLEKEEPELAQEDDIAASSTPPAPADAPKPANPEPLQEPVDPEKGRVKVPEPGKPEHPTQ